MYVSTVETHQHDLQRNWSIMKVPHKWGQEVTVWRLVGMSRVKNRPIPWITYPLVNIQKAIENGHRNSRISHWKWWFSIVMLVYQRVPIPHCPSHTISEISASTRLLAGTVAVDPDVAAALDTVPGQTLSEIRRPAGSIANHIAGFVFLSLTEFKSLTHWFLHFLWFVSWTLRFPIEKKIKLTSRCVRTNALWALIC
jgi:hypothetical protein